jgi:catechol 2,3-dioxygenase-like lactoylglutathione lyase family enzyme
VDRPEIGARLDHLCVQSSDPDAMAAFFEQAFAMQKTALGTGWQCVAREREILIQPGQPNRTAFLAFAFDDDDDLERYRAMLLERVVPLGRNPSPHFGESAFSVSDPDRNLTVFGSRRRQAAPDAWPGRLQHAALRTPRLDEMVAFYAGKLGYTVSDRVEDEQGLLRACFLRTDPEHHSLALFRASESRLDHHSYETRDWDHIQRWADRMGEHRVPLFWGVGRHGPGNDVFFMVRDVDGNLVEISAELEVCPAERQVRIWPHEPHTLNLWGNAIMRS